MSKNAACKICRRLGEKLFLKGEKCLSPKCPFLRKPYPPGIHKKSIKLTGYGEELKEVQKLKKMYYLKEKQFKKIVRNVLKKRGKEDLSLLLLKKLEVQLFNIIYRAGLASSRRGARQLVSHGHFLLNGKNVNIPSIEVKLNQEIKLKESSKNKNYFKNILPLIKEKEVPSWISFDKEKNIIKVVNEASVTNINKVNIPLIFSFYSR